MKTRFANVNSPKALAAALSQRRADLDMTQAEVAYAAGVSRQWLVAVEQGKSTAEIGRVLRVVRVLGLDVGLTIRPPSTSIDAILNG